MEKNRQLYFTPSTNGHRSPTVAPPDYYEVQPSHGHNSQQVHQSIRQPAPQMQPGYGYDQPVPTPSVVIAETVCQPYLMAGYGPLYQHGGSQQAIVLTPMNHSGINLSTGSPSHHQVQQNQQAVVINNGQPETKPNNYRCLAIITLIFNLPFGIAALFFSCRSDESYEEGDVEWAKHRGNTSMLLSVAGILLTLAVIIICVSALTVAVSQN